MRIKPVDNVYFGAHLPQKQKDNNMKDEGPISHNGRMVDKSRIVDGLCELKDWLKYNTESAYRGEHRVLSDHDHAYYQEVIEAARDYLLED